MALTTTLVSKTVNPELLISELSSHSDYHTQTHPFLSFTWVSWWPNVSKEMFEDDEVAIFPTVSKQ